jgi:uncharacterized protein YoxC
MSPILVYVISGVLIALTIAIIPLIQQLLRTAASAERFLDSAKEDLRHIQQDVRAARERVDALSSSAQIAVDQMNGLVRHVGDVGSGLKLSVEGLVSRLGGSGGSSMNLGGILGIIASVITLLRRPKGYEA